MWKLMGEVEFENGSSDSMYITYTGTLDECKNRLAEAIEKFTGYGAVDCCKLKLERVK